MQLSETPKVTFIMPAYNVGKYIAEAISSIKNQTIGNWELIVVDDGSTDDMVDIVKELMKEDSRILLLTMDMPSGSAYSPRKKGIEAAKTEWVAPLDADDWIAADYLERLWEKQKQTGADAVYPTMYKANGSCITRTTPFNDEIYRGKRPGKDCVSLTLDRWQINCNGGLIKREAYISAFPKMKPDWLKTLYSDELLTRLLLSVCRSVAFSETEYFYRLNPESVTQKKSIRQYDFLKRNRSLLEIIGIEFGKDSEEYRLAQRQNFHGFFEGLRLMKAQPGMTAEEKEIVKNLIKSSGKEVDLKQLKGFVSPRYYQLFKLGLPATGLLLPLIDRIKRRCK